MICWREWGPMYQVGRTRSYFCQAYARDHCIRRNRSINSLPGTMEWANYQIRYDSFISRIAAATLLLSETDWHFVAFVWESSNGVSAFWFDTAKAGGIGKFTGRKIAGGKFLIGEREGKDPQKTKNRFEGRITCLQMWKKSLSDVHITELYNTKRSQDGECYTVHDSYSLLTWAQIKTAKAKGEVSLSWPSSLSRLSKWNQVSV